jgi:glycosyltransferase involved in cell wall biosynthesis
MSIKITIISATFNSALTLDDCLASVSSQSVPAEHLIIDGGSTDKTLAIAASYPHVSKIISGRDAGIYDAMNKGIALATGDVVGILNSDDFYASKDVLGWVAEIFADQSMDSCYGDLVYVDPIDTNRVTRNWKSGEFKDKGFYWGWMPPHPTFFVRRSVYEKYGMFNLNLGSAADYELMLRFLVKHKISTAYIPEVLVKMRAGGVSNVTLGNRLKANRMDRYAWTVNGLTPYPWTIIAKPLRKIGQFLQNK